MEKIEVRVDVEYYLGLKDTQYPTVQYITIEQLEKDIEAMKELGVTELEIHSDVDYNNIPCTSILPKLVRLENDEEVQKRAYKLQTQIEDQRRKDIREYERLKNLFN